MDSSLLEHGHSGEQLAVDYLLAPWQAGRHWPRLQYALERREALFEASAGHPQQEDYLLFEGEVYRAELELIESLLELDLQEETENGLEVSAGLVQGQLDWFDQQLAASAGLPAPLPLRRVDSALSAAQEDGVEISR